MVRSHALFCVAWLNLPLPSNKIMVKLLHNCLHYNMMNLLSIGCTVAPKYAHKIGPFSTLNFSTTKISFFCVSEILDKKTRNLKVKTVQGITRSFAHINVFSILPWNTRKTVSLVHIGQLTPASVRYIDVYLEI